MKGARFWVDSLRDLLGRVEQRERGLRVDVVLLELADGRAEGAHLELLVGERLDLCGSHASSCPLRAES